MFALEAQYEGRLAVEHVGLDVGLRESQLAILLGGATLPGRMFRWAHAPVVRTIRKRALPLIMRS